MKLAVVFLGCLQLLKSATANMPPADVASPPQNARKDGGGVFSIELTPGTAPDHPSTNDCVVIRFTAWRRDGSLFSTAGPNGTPGTQCLAVLTPAFGGLLMSMTPGERRRAWLPPQTSTHAAIADDEAVLTGSLTIDLELIRIRKAPATPPDLLKPPQSARRLRSGVSMLILEKGAGVVHPSIGNKLKLTYTAWNVSGKLLESTMITDSPADLPLALTPPGWREPLLGMVAGDTVRLWIPASLIADKPPGDRVYDLKLLKVE